MADVMVATRTVMVRVGDTVHQVWVNQTTAHPDSEVVRDHPDLWRVMVPDFPAPDDPAVLLERPADRSGRPAWDAYAVALGLNPEGVAALSTKGDVIALADGLTAGTLVLGDDGQVVDVSTPGG